MPYRRRHAPKRDRSWVTCQPLTVGVWSRHATSPLLVGGKVRVDCNVAIGAAAATAGIEASETRP
ncbi:MAG TPA: hypothetical protein VFD01_00705 [Candidatus Dormibacteraeota bacterium]|nr:hypothetical protein [Candidatus Dormibacteraeota bacterium]